MSDPVSDGRSPNQARQLWPARDWHREVFNDYTESEFSKLARRVAWASGVTYLTQRRRDAEERARGGL